MPIKRRKRRSSQSKKRSQNKGAFKSGLGFYNWGNFNVYPNYVKELILSSATASLAWDLNYKFIFGEGFPNIGSEEVDSRRMMNINDIALLCSKDISALNGFAIHVDYGVDYIPVQMQRLPVEWVRVGAKDDDGFYSHIEVCEDWVQKCPNPYLKGKDWKRGGGYQQPIRVFNAFNPDPRVVKAQIAFDAGLLEDGRDPETVGDDEIIAAGGFEKYTGQVLFIHMDMPSTYPVSTIHATRDDAESEIENQGSRLTRSRRGYGAKQIIIQQEQEIPKLSNPKEKEEYEKGIEQDVDNLVYFAAHETEGSLMHLSVKHRAQKLDDAIKVIDINPEINVEAETYADEKAQTNIENSFDNPPTPLLRASEGALFSPDANTLQEYRDFYNDQTAYKRNFINRWFNVLFNAFGIEGDEIQPLFQNRNANTE